MAKMVSPEGEKNPVMKIRSRAEDNFLMSKKNPNKKNVLYMQKHECGQLLLTDPQVGLTTMTFKGRIGFL